MRKLLVLPLLVSLFNISCGQNNPAQADAHSTSKAQTTVDLSNMERALFASGCFWGTEYYMRRANGVVQTSCGYTGGHVENPTYKQVCTGTTGHAEAVEVYYDPSITNYEAVCKIFFETHDPTHVNRQGPDIGTQYRSGVFYLDESQKETAENLIKVLREKGLKVATEVTKAKTFYPAEEYHQDYYEYKGSSPYCHVYTKRF